MHRMWYKGSNRAEREEAIRRWSIWCQQSQNDKLREFAERLMPLIESRVGVSVRVAYVAEQAMKDAGRDQLTDAELREVILILYRTWKHGLSLRNWAKLKTNLLRDED